MKKLLLFTFAIVSATLWAADSNLVKIGVILPLTGNMAQTGQPQLAAVELFKKECTNGTYKHKYEVIVEDDQLTGRLTAEATNKLINIDHVDAIISFSAGSGHVVMPRATSAKIPHICLASDPTVGDNKYNFINWVTPERESAALVDLVEKLHGKRIAFLTTRQQGALAILKNAESELKKRGLTEVSNIIFNAGERDFRTTLVKIREANPDVFIPLAFSPEMEIILRQSKQMGLKAKITTTECFDFLTDMTDAEGLYYVSGGSGTKEFDQRLFHATGKHSWYMLPYSYECLNIIRKAYESIDKPDHAAAALWISNMKNSPSALGVISIMPDGRIDSQPDFFQIFKGKAERVTLEEIK